MAQYIDKSALAAEIEKIISDETESIKSFEHNKNASEVQRSNARIGVLTYLHSFLTTLEVKEIDLEDSIKESLAQKYIDYTFKRHNIDPDSRYGQLLYYAYMHGMNQCLDKLNAQKGENV